MKILSLLACMFFASSMLAQQDCVKAVVPFGSLGYPNGKTGNAAVSQKNQNGVATTQTSNGGKAKTKNGMGVSQGPGGTDCAKGKNHEGCAKKYIARADSDFPGGPWSAGKLCESGICQCRATSNRLTVLISSDGRHTVPSGSKFSMLYEKAPRFRRSRLGAFS